MGLPSIREVFGSALDAAAHALGALGYAEQDAARVVRRFRDHDERQIFEAAPHRNDLKKLIALQQQGRRDIAQLLAAEVRSESGA